MSKPSAQPKVDKGSALAFAKAIRTSPRKLNLVAQLIRGKNVARALHELSFCRKRIAGPVKAVLQSAIANAENNHGLDVDLLEVAEATVGRAFVMKRFHTRGRGRSAGIEKPFSNLRVVVRERKEEEKPVVAKKSAAAAKDKVSKSSAKPQKQKKSEVKENA